MNPLTGLPDAAQLQRPGKATRLLAFIVVMVLPLGLSTLDPELGKHARFGGAAASIAAIALLLVPLWFGVDWLLRRQQLRWNQQMLQVTSSFYRRSLPLADQELDKARVIDLQEQIDYSPRWKTNGTSLPGLKSGWFRLRNGNKALVALYGKGKVLWLPTRQGFDLLLQPHDPQALLDHLRQLALSTRPA